MLVWKWVNMKNKMWVICILSLATAFCHGKTIVLKNEMQIKGEILAHKQEYIIIDLGFETIRIPQDNILRIEEDQVRNKTDDPNGTQIQQKEQGRLYYTNHGQFHSIEKTVKTVSEAVVLVSHPGGLGSGFFINEDGYLITNFHVIEKETKITVTLFKKTETGFDKVKFKKVKIVAINPFVDLALLKVEDLEDIKLSYVPLADIEEIQVGQKVFAIGNPLGLERSVHDGIVSTKNRSFEGLVYIQTNTDINPGNSGGPLFNLKGQVVGVTNMGYIFMGGLGFAIPVNYVKDFINNYEAFAYDIDAPNTGYKYIQPDGKQIKN